jgi:nitroimidazol reductase NimA-like FMN-containing flavoprotein (pyridoxamine 5'-phosphate oxidase superfamily)
VVYECADGTTFFMYRSDGAGTSRASCAYWEVNDVAAEVADLKTRGVEFEHYDLPGTDTDGDIATGGGTKAAWFKDPDGNILALIEAQQPPRPRNEPRTAVTSNAAPIVELDAPYSDEAARPTPWADAVGVLDAAGVCWLSTVRSDGRPHVTPVATVWLDDAVHFSTGPGEVKAKNLAACRDVVVTTGTNGFRDGLDVVIDGRAEQVRDHVSLERLCSAFTDKYDDHFGFEVVTDHFEHDQGGVAHVYRVVATKAFAYGRGSSYSATRYRFGP